MTEGWEAEAKKPAPFRAGFRTSGRGERSAEQRPDADAGIDPAFVDHLDRDIEDHRKADIGDPAIALDIFGDDIRRDTHQRHREDQPNDQYAGMLARGAGHREHIVEAHADVGDRNRSEENTSELKSLMRISYAVFCLKKNK